MKRKQQFLKAVRILAPDDPFVLQIAQRIPEERLPAYPGGAALEFVVAMQKLREPTREAFFEPAVTTADGRTQGKSAQDRISLSHALRVKSAEYWLKLGEPAQAMMELGRLPESAKHHPSVLKVHVAAIKAVKERNEMTVQE